MFFSCTIISAVFSVSLLYFTEDTCTLFIYIATSEGL